MTTTPISVPKQFSEGNSTERFQRFEISVVLMVGEMKRLLTLLEGEALAVWLELSEAEKKSHKDANAKILE